MKKTTLALLGLLVAVFVFSSCNRNDTEDPTPTPDPIESLVDQQNATEKEPINLSVLEGGITVPGTKKDGAPPAPTGKVDIQVNSTEVTALQEHGLYASFSSTDFGKVAGAYIVFKEEGGETSNSYFDIPASEFRPEGWRVGNSKSEKKGNKLTLGNNQRTNEIEDAYIPIDLSNVPAGRFCYDICIYDTDNNISQIIEVCVEIEAWGGNSEIIGSWDLKDAIYTYGGMSVSFKDIECENGDILNLEESEVFEHFNVNMIFNEDGTWVFNIDMKEHPIDYDASYEDCSLVPGTEEGYHEKYTEKGKWSYDEENNQLFLVLFESIDELEPEYSYVDEDGELLIRGDFSINGDRLTITEEFSYDGGIERYELIFDRQ